MGSKWWVRHALAGALLFAFGGILLLVAHTRGVDGDEPFYAAAIHSVARGKRLYVDFFHPQGPVQPLLYAPFYAVGLRDLQGLRGISVGCCVLTGLVWWRLLTRLMPTLAAAARSGPSSSLPCLRWWRAMQRRCQRVRSPWSPDSH